ncbi:multidrug and toxin extrusion protein 1 isoform X1 [Salmo salar]|uniref:Multidrug and toxin extrusion protein n=2 Tax=Salmo salar TaxID=8030 RepID=A0A1S3MNW5_SALSA|nr:multidrug and toxin extrusion protein 1 isoform X1 [Salmo salar]|eukprot:XP_014004877.1 PREDICTED: multidrug and toxin extrusion protein 1-like isoform X1 [Salmo salar]
MHLNRNLFSLQNANVWTNDCTHVFVGTNGNNDLNSAKLSKRFQYIGCGQCGSKMEEVTTCIPVNPASKGNPPIYGSIISKLPAECGSFSRARRWMSVEIEEMVEILKLAGPMFISMLMLMLISFVSTVFCGHLGKTELAAVTLATSVVNITGISIGTGLASAFDTVISQIFGSNNLKYVGVIVQRGILILLLSCFPCWALLINTEPILLAIHQSPEVSRLTQLYVRIFMPALPACFMYQLQGRYLQNQGIIWPQVITGVVGNLLNAITNYTFLYQLNLGVAGSAAANTISQYTLAIVIYVYIIWRGLHKATWDGWSRDCLQEWGPFLYLAVPSMLMMCLEWWTYEIGVFMAGLIGEAELGAMSALYQVSSITFMFPLGFAVAANVRMGNALGAGNTEQAKLSGKVSFICAITVSLVIAIILGLTKDVLGYIFTQDQDVIKKAAPLLLLYAFHHVFDAIAVLMGGVVRGAGKQMVGAVSYLVGYYIIGLPIAVSLMFPFKMCILGFRIGFFLCSILHSVFLIVYMCKLNWKQTTYEALVRAGVQSLKENAPCLEKTQGSNQTLWTNELSPVGVVLSVRHLVLRRGLAVVIMLLILAIGIVTNQLLTVPLPTMPAPQAHITPSIP